VSVARRSPVAAAGTCGDGANSELSTNMAATVLERTDVDLVIAARSGDHEAFAQIYDRYAARIYDLCCQMLHDRTEAEDAAADVFLKAAERIGQLRNPTKCKSWLYAIARHEVYRRTKRRARERPTDFDDPTPMNMTPLTDTDPTQPQDLAALGQLLRDAALGLDERDRMVLEMSLAGGLEGRALGDALGVSEAGGHQAAHRMRERLGRSVGALLVSRQGRADCTELQRVLAGWDGTFSVLWRKRVARHIDDCPVCDRRRKAVPAWLFDGTAFAATPIAYRTPPAALRDRVLRSMDLAPPRRHWLRRVLVAGAVAVLLLIGLAVGLNESKGHPTPVGTSTLAGDAGAAVGSGQPVNGAAGSPTKSGGKGTKGQTTGTTGASGTSGTSGPGKATTTTTAPDRTPPTLSVSVPPTLYSATSGNACGANPSMTATASDSSGVASVTMSYSGPASGSAAFAPTGGGSWSYNWRPPADGSYTVTITARDTVGNTTSATRAVSAGGCLY